MKKGCMIVAATLALVLLGAAVVLWIADGRYRVLRASPRVAHDEIITVFPNVRGIVTFTALEAYARQSMEKRLGRSVPSWLVAHMMPYEAALVFHVHDDGRIGVSAFLNERRLGPVIAGRLGELDWLTEMKQIEWTEKGLEWTAPGVLIMEGNMPTDRHAEEAAFLVWNQGFQRSPLPLEGRHLFEAVADNRDGGAYIVMTSFIQAFGIKLDKQEEEISLSTIQFIISARLTLDLMQDDTLQMRLQFDVMPEARNRLAVANLQGAINEGLATWAKRLAQRQSISLEGSSHWEGSVMHFEYRMMPFSKAIEAAIGGHLF